ncbi:MAG: ATP-dependent sacrificial sulfur transferase LarE [Candidatus Omnitrophica bacterium]|nr:ATP-dependent sacrificial sulfur transferase LarE [Candidatus Omnitrophota bacterium]
MVKLPKNLAEKLEKLKEIILNMQSLIVAYSGGVDSTFLLRISQDVLKDRVLAVIVQSEIYPQREIKYAVRIAKDLKVPFLILRTEPLKNKSFLRNSLKRCYFCKREVFSKIRKIAKEKNFAFVSDGSNYDDLSDFRAGFKAGREFKVRTPLIEAKFTKEEIRYVSKFLGLHTWDKPPLACLATRVPYGLRIEREYLKRIDRAENYILSMGIRQVRVRDYKKMARIEVLSEDFPTIVNNSKRITKYLHKLGYLLVTLDLEGYTPGKRINRNSFI